MEKEGCKDDWELAQAIDVSIHLLEAAREELQFLAQVDAHPSLYHNHHLISLAIYRYENCWLPLLASHGSLASPNLPYIPPLDCAWIWHCHRLNPVQYAKDCDTLYGELIDCVSPYVFNLDEVAREDATKATENLWEHLYPEEKYLLDLDQFPFTSGDVNVNGSTALPCESRKIAYDLHVAVSRQCTFFYQVSQPHMKDEAYLKMAVQRYKGFLYLLKITERNFFLVPLYDVDVIWHAHILSPRAYMKDMMELFGRSLEHDDTDSDRSPGMKLHTGFEKTKKLWEHHFGFLYVRAGAMYRGDPPSDSSLPSSPSPISALAIAAPQIHSNDEYLIPRKTLNVHLTVIGARNVPLEKKGEFFVRVRMKNKCDTFKLETLGLPSTSDPEWRKFWLLVCELNTEGLCLELWFRSQSFLWGIIGGKPLFIGSIVLSWQSILASPTLSLDGWVSLQTKSHLSKGPELRVAMTITTPATAPFVLRSVISPLTYDNATVSLEGMRQSRTILDHDDREVFVVGLSVLDANESEGTIQVYAGPCERDTSNTYKFEHEKVIASARQATQVGSSKKWSLLGDSVCLNVIGRSKDSECQIAPTFELTGNIGYPARLIPGRKLQYQVKSAKADESGFISFVRYTPDRPLGKATALFNWESGELQVSPEESVILMLLISYAVSVSLFDIYGSENPFKIQKL